MHEALVASHNCTLVTAIDSRRSTVDRRIKVSSVRSRNEFGTGCHASLKCCHERGTV